MTLSDYIKRLQALEAIHGDLPVVITQSGYYSDSLFAEVFDIPEVKNFKSPAWQTHDTYDVTAVVLGHSHQSY